jgi:hypothetical protein
MKKTTLLIGLYLVVFFTLCCRLQPAETVLSGNIIVNSEWIELVPKEPLVATTALHIIGLSVKNVKTWSNDTRISLKLDDDSELSFDIELVGENGEITKLYPNSIAKFIEFGKRTFDKTKIDDAYFKNGEKFSKVRIRSNKQVSVEQVIWAKFDF